MEITSVVERVRHIAAVRGDTSVDVVSVARRLGYVEGTQETERPEFVAELAEHPLWVRGSPDLAAQMLDKLIENAADFATEGTPIRISLAFEGTTRGALAVSNLGPQIPTELLGSLFESMVSVRPGAEEGRPHLGIGLFVARLIAGVGRGPQVAAALLLKSVLGLGLVFGLLCLLQHARAWVRSPHA